MANQSLGAWERHSYSLEALAMHAAMLQTGKVLYFSGDDSRLWDPATNQITQPTNQPTMAGRSVFCSGHVFLSDGKLLVAGGTVLFSNPRQGIQNTWIYDPVTNTWTEKALMTNGRYYPTLVRAKTSAPNEEAIVMSGYKFGLPGGEWNNMVEAYNPMTDSWRVLIDQPLTPNFEWYP